MEKYQENLKEKNYRRMVEEELECFIWPIRSEI